MSNSVQYHAVTPYLMCAESTNVIDFYKEVFGAEETFRLTQPDGVVGHAELKIGDSTLMLTETCREDAQSQDINPIALLLYVDDVDAQFTKAVDKGAQVIRPVQDQFYGDRTGTVKDPAGQVWIIATHKEDLSPEELKRRADSHFERIPQD